LRHLVWRLFRSGTRCLDQLICGNRELFCLRIAFREEEQIWFRIRFPAEPTEVLADCFFVDAKAAGNPSIAHPLGFEAENSLVSLMFFLVSGRTACRSSSGARQRAQSTSLEVLLIAAKRSDRVAEAACDIVLIRVSRFEKRNHGVGLGSTIFDGIVGKDDAMDENYSLFFLGLYTNAIVYKNSTGSWSRTGKKFLLRWRRAHGFLACPIPQRFKKRTGLGPHPGKRKTKQIAVPKRSAKENSKHFSFGSRGIGTPETYSCRLKKRTGLGPHPNLDKPEFLPLF
jgi:hypothetical protein